MYLNFYIYKYHAVYAVQETTHQSYAIKIIQKKERKELEKENY